MRRDDSAYAALGLRAGASRAEVDHAYRRLIKLHHPDRNGGDSSRAAEINRAYTLLRRDLPAPPAYRSVPVPVRQRPRRRRSSRPFWLLVLVVSVGIGALAAQDDRRAPPAYRALLPAPPGSFAPPSMSGTFDQPLHDGVVDAAIRTAAQFQSAKDLRAAVEYSRDCHQRLRETPNLALFDACAAFDEANVTLGVPSEAAGAFNGAAVLGRELAGARAISQDVLGVDSRLHRIRSRVELALLPKLDEAAAPQVPEAL